MLLFVLIGMVLQRRIQLLQGSRLNFAAKAFWLPVRVFGTAFGVTGKSGEVVTPTMYALPSLSIAIFDGKSAPEPPKCVA